MRGARNGKQQGKEEGERNDSKNKENAIHDRKSEFMTPCYDDEESENCPDAPSGAGAFGGSGGGGGGSAGCCCGGDAGLLLLPLLPMGLRGVLLPLSAVTPRSSPGPPHCSCSSDSGMAAGNAATPMAAEGRGGVEALSGVLPPRSLMLTSWSSASSEAEAPGPAPPPLLPLPPLPSLHPPPPPPPPPLRSGIVLLSGERQESDDGRSSGMDSGSWMGTTAKLLTGGCPIRHPASLLLPPPPTPTSMVPLLLLPGGEKLLGGNGV